MARNPTQLRAELEQTAKDIDVDLFGVADITRLHEYLAPRGGDFLRDYPRAIPIGARVPDGAIEPLVDHYSYSSQWTYRHCLFVSVIPALDRATLVMTKKLEDAGYRAHPIYTIDMSQDPKGWWAYPLKLTGYLAGFGWIGKSSLLINPKFGPRFRLSVILTDAPFTTDSPIAGSCGTCQDCIDVCPSKALSVGVSFDPNNPREDWSHGKICKDYRNQRVVDIPFPDTRASCAMCLYVCPFGKKHATKSKGQGAMDRA